MNKVIGLPFYNRVDLFLFDHAIYFVHISYFFDKEYTDLRLAISSRARASAPFLIISRCTQQTQKTNIRVQYHKKHLPDSILSCLNKQRKSKNVIRNYFVHYWSNVKATYASALLCQYSIANKVRACAMLVIDFWHKKSTAYSTCTLLDTPQSLWHNIND